MSRSSKARSAADFPALEYKDWSVDAKDNVNWVALSPNSKLLALQTNQDTQVFDTLTSKKLDSLPGGGILTRCFWSRKGDMLATTSRNRGHVFSIVKGKLQRKNGDWEDNKGMQGGAFSPDGKTIVFCSSTKTECFIHFFKTKRGKFQRSFKKPRKDGKSGDLRMSVCFTPDARFLIVTYAHKSYPVEVWDVASQSVVDSFPTRGNTYEHVCTSQDGTHVAMTYSQGISVYTYADGKFTLVRHISSWAFEDSGNQMMSVISNDNKSVISAGYSVPCEYSIETGEALRELKGMGEIQCVAISHDSKMHALALYGAQRVALLNSNYQAWGKPERQSACCTVL